jgi:uncharacterized protein (TIGR01244 family)
MEVLMPLTRFRAVCILPVALALTAAAGRAEGLAKRAEIPRSMESGLVPNYQVVREGLAVGGQPSPKARLRLRALGFRTVIDLRTQAEGIRGEEAAVRAQGLRYVSVPVTPGTFTIEDVKKVKAVLDDEKAAPVLLHCASANRVGAVWTVLRVQEGLPMADAEREGERIGLKSEEMRQAVRRVLGRPSP